MVGARACFCHQGTAWEIRALLPLCGSWNEIQDVKLGGKCLYSLRHLTSL